MKAHLQTQGGKITFEMEANSPKELFKKLALVQEVFDADSECGCCGSGRIRFRSRQVDTFEYYELGCLECYARLQFGQHKTGGGLFAKRKDEDGNYLDNRGWSVYKKQETTSNGNGHYQQSEQRQPQGYYQPPPQNKHQQQGVSQARRDEIIDSEIPF